MSDDKPDGKGGFRGDYHVFRNVRPGEWTKVELDFDLPVDPVRDDLFSVGLAATAPTERISLRNLVFAKREGR